MKPIAFIIALMLLPALVCAQPAPPSPNGPPGGPPGGQAGPGGENGPGQSIQERFHQRRDGEQPGGGDNNGPPPNGPMRQYEMMKQYLDLVDRYAAVSRDPTTAGIAAVVAAADTLRPRGPDAAIDYFTKLLPEVKNEAVARAIRAQLADIYKQSGQQDKALDQLKTLITGAEAEPAQAAH